MSQSHKHLHYRKILTQGAKVSLFLSFVLLVMGFLLGYLSPASRSPLFGWTPTPRTVRIANTASDLTPVSAIHNPRHTNILITAKSGAFTPSKINVGIGDAVSLQLKSEDGAYTFFLPSKDIHQRFDASKIEQVELMFFKEGTHSFASTIYAPGYEKTKGSITVVSDMMLIDDARIMDGDESLMMHR